MVLHEGSFLVLAGALLKSYTEWFLVQQVQC